MSTDELFEKLRSTALFQPVDLHLARLFSRMSGGDDPLLFLSVCLVSSSLSRGDVCLDLTLHGGTVIPVGEDRFELPPPDKWTLTLRNSPVVGDPDTFAPLILDQRARLYLHRYHAYEQGLAGMLLQRATVPQPNRSPGLQQSLDALFPVPDDDPIDWQRIAALAAVRNRLCIISGGPGTGKTTTVAKILALLLMVEPERTRIGLAAPTGKAAARLQEAIASVKPSLTMDPALREKIPAHASTIHRLLGTIPGAVSFRHNRKNPLPLDTLVVDEASMVDLSLMHRLLEALPDDCRLILLGDRDQLASVEGGAVLGDICSHVLAERFTPAFASRAPADPGALPVSPEAPPLSDCIVMLRRSYRFSGGGIEPLRLAVRDQDEDRTLEVLQDENLPEVRLLPCASPAELARLMENALLAGYGPVFAAGSPREAISSLERLRVLSPLREGPYGTNSLNLLVERVFENRGTIPVGAGGRYRGRPLLIERNDYALQLFNGDLGVLWHEDGTLQACFSSPGGGTRALPPALLPEHVTAFAMTVHKSQGSEFDQVLLVLPDQDLPILSRELLYTAVTRARRSVTIIGSESMVRCCVRRRTFRSSGLADRLWAGRRP